MSVIRKTSSDAGIIMSFEVEHLVEAQVINWRVYDVLNWAMTIMGPNESEL